MSVRGKKREEKKRVSQLTSLRLSSRFKETEEQFKNSEVVWLSSITASSSSNSRFFWDDASNRTVGFFSSGSESGAEVASAAAAAKGGDKLLDFDTGEVGSALVSALLVVFGVGIDASQNRTVSFFAIGSGSNAGVASVFETAKGGDGLFDDDTGEVGGALVDGFLVVFGVGINDCRCGAAPKDSSNVLARW
jgi:hypothetical protein